MAVAVGIGVAERVDVAVGRGVGVFMGVKVGTSVGVCVGGWVLGGVLVKVGRRVPRAQGVGLGMMAATGSSSALAVSPNTA
jgi:hypothetical protein